MRSALYACALLGLAGLMFWRLESPPSDRLERAPEPASRVHEQAHAAVIERANDGLPIMLADAPAEAPVEPMHPHPITPAHERIFRENNLVGALNLAVDLENAPRILELLARYRAEYPEDEHRLQEGYAIIAACLERLDAETRDRAQHFWSTEIRSQTRRYVRRYCLERELS